MSSEFLDIILFAVVAIFLVMRLKKILGSDKGKIISFKNQKSEVLRPKTTTTKTKTNINDDFLVGANQAFPMIVEAYQANDTSKVKDLLTEEAFKILNENKSPAHIKFTQIKSSKIISSDETDTRLVNLVGFESEHYDVNVNDTITVTEEWGFEKDKKSIDPNWKLFSIKVVS
jgi:predicted lipid-binding transport protein (Tim44 family)|tara:strand:- start:954 stop:1472 length:519 start_codon:yes stop_codon:yes gene_type:complete